MPTFDTRGPVSVHLEVGLAEVRITAGDRSDTVVDVRPADPAKKRDIAAAEQTRVEYADGVLRIKAPKSWRSSTFRNGGEGIDVHIELPAGSSLQGEGGAGAVRATGRLGECRFRTGAGDIELEEAGPVSLKSGVGALGIGRASGHCTLTTGSGGVRVGVVDGTAAVKNGNGDTEIGEVTGDVRVSSANGKVLIGRAHATVAVRTANGDIRIGEVARGAVSAQTAYGRIDVGVRPGVATWLDLHTAFGKVESDLAASEPPGPGEDTVELKAHTAFGDVTIRRAAAQSVTGTGAKNA